MNKENLYQLIKRRNVKILSSGLRFECERYSGAHNHQVHGSIKQHFFLYEIGEEGTGYDTNMTYEDMKREHPHDFDTTLDVIHEAITKLKIKI